MPRLSDEMRKEAKRYANEDDLVRELIPEVEPGQPIYYDRRRNKLTVRVDVDQKSCRVVFQGINDRDASHLERLIELLDKENPWSVMIPLAPFDAEAKSVYRHPTEIDDALIGRYSGRKTFKVSAEARVVYEKLSNLKRVSVNQSMLYNFSSEGAFAEL